MVKKSEKPSEQSTGHIAMPGFLRIMIAILILVLFSILFTWFILYRQQLNDVDATWEFVTRQPLIFWYSCVITFFITAFIAALCWRVFLGAGIAFSLFSILMYINAEKFKIRRTPLLPEDFQMAENVGEVASFVDPWGIVRLVAGIILILAGAAVLEHWVRKVFGRRRQDLVWWQRWAILPRTSFALLAGVGFVMTSQSLTNNIHGGGGEIEWLDLTYVAWNQYDNYAQNGFIVAFLYNLGKPVLEAPATYSSETIAEIKEKYTKIEDKQNADRKDNNEIADNVIIILDETFYDFELLDKYYSHPGSDALPNLHKIFQQHPSGYMYSPEYGGGTANIEFEVLTGLSNYWTSSVPYTNMISKLSNFPSVVRSLKDDGFKTTALHSYDGSVYKRNLVYPNIGYETFIDIDQMQHTAKENGVGNVSDAETFQEIIDLLNANDGKQVIGVATMQNHMPYCMANYGRYDYVPNLKPGSESNLAALACSFQSIHNADKYLGEFLAKLDKLDEKTVVLWFGDHAAGILDDYKQSEEKSEQDLAHLTPYFIYTNFKLDQEDDAKEIQKSYQTLGFDLKIKGIDLPITTPNCLSNTMYNLLDAKKPAMMYLLDDVCTEVPILARAYYGNDGQPSASEALSAYELLNYDLLLGERYWQK